jgi:ferredoxin
MIKDFGHMKQYPVIDLGLCSDCRGCIEIAPRIFQHNPATGLMEVIECVEYPAALVDEAIKNCPEDCIFWETEE